VIYTTAKPAPGTSDKGCMPLWACAVEERSNPYLSPRPNWKRERELHARPSGYEPDEVLLFYPANWCPEKCSHLRLFLFREALALSQLSRRNWYARPELNWHAEAQSSHDCVFRLFHHGRMVRILGLAPRSNWV
jgi:hypothetical protein